MMAPIQTKNYVGFCLSAALYQSVPYFDPNLTAIV
jgi:hypothetical protein